MSTVRVEWVALGASPGFDSRANSVIRDTYDTPTAAFPVTGTATPSGSRPTAPTPPVLPDASSRSRLYARVSGVIGNTIVAWGDDPTATQTNGLLVMAGGVELVPINAGQKLSFIELA